MGTYTHDLLIRYAACMVDRTEHEQVPHGWQAIVAVLVRDLAEALAAHPDRVIQVTQIKEKFGALRFYIHCGGGEAGGAVRSALSPIIAAAEAKSAATCQVCGMPGRTHKGRRWATLCDVHARRQGAGVCGDGDLEGDGDHDPQGGIHSASTDAVVSSWTLALTSASTPSLQDRPHKLYRLRAIADALGRPADMVENDVLPDRADTEHEARLGAILRQGESGTWRGLAMPEAEMVTRLDALDAAAPHMAAVTTLVRRHVQAALVVGLPISLPHILLLGEPGLGKTWYLTQLGSALGVPTRTYPMAAATLGEGLQGSHPSWRNASSGLVAKTLLQESVANPLILVDEVDKPGQGNWNQDPFRPFYTLLEPAGARAFRDEYLGFEMDASAVMWMLAANHLQPLPDPILSRITVMEIPPLSRHHLAAVARSIYAEANGRMKCFFDPDLAPATLDGLLDLTPRAIRMTLQDAMVRAAAQARTEITRADLVPPQQGKSERIGFLTGRP